MQAIVKVKKKKTHSITRCIDLLCEKMGRFDLKIKGYTPRSLNLFMSYPVQIQNQIENVLTFSLEVLNSAPGDLRPSDLDSFMLFKACDSMNLKVAEDFLERVSQGDIIEIYDFKTQTQIYRNFEFLRHCSYDLLTVCILPYPELFERDHGFNEKIQKRTEEITNFGHQTEPWGVPDHHLIERLDSRHRKFLLKLGYVGPVYQAVSGQRIGWASTIRASNLGSTYKDFPNVVPL